MLILARKAPYISELKLIGRQEVIRSKSYFIPFIEKYIVLYNLYSDVGVCTTDISVCPEKVPVTAVQGFV